MTHMSHSALRLTHLTKCSICSHQLKHVHLHRLWTCLDRWLKDWKSCPRHLTVVRQVNFTLHFPHGSGARRLAAPGADSWEDLWTGRGPPCTTGCRASPRSTQELKPDRNLQGIVEQIPDDPMLGKAEQLVEVPETVSRDGVQQRTVEQIVDAPVPQAVEELSEVSKVFSQGKIQQRIVEQIIPAIPLAEKIVELPVIQTEEKMQRGVNTHVQHVVNAVEVEKSEIIEGTVQRKKPIIQEKINQVTRHVEIPVLQIIEKTVETPVTLLQFTDKVVNIPVLAQRQISRETVQKSTEIPQLRYCDQVVDVPVQLVAQVPRVLVVEKTTEIPQFWAAELFKFNTSKPGDEQISFKEYVNRMKEGQNDISHITDESIAAVSSSSFRENLRRKGYEVLYMADPVDEFAVQQPKECDGTKPKSTMREDLEADIAKHTGAVAWKRQPHSSKQQQQQAGQRKRVKEERRKKGTQRNKSVNRSRRTRRVGQWWPETRGRERWSRYSSRWMEVRQARWKWKWVTGWMTSWRGPRWVIRMFTWRVVEELLRTSDKLESCEVRDGSTVEITSRMRGGGRHKDKKNKVREEARHELTETTKSAMENQAILRRVENWGPWMKSGCGWKKAEEYRKIVEWRVRRKVMWDMRNGKCRTIWHTVRRCRGAAKEQFEHSGKCETQMGGWSKEKRKGQTARATAASKARGKDRTGTEQARQASAFRRRTTAEEDGSGKRRRIRGDG